MAKQNRAVRAGHARRYRSSPRRKLATRYHKPLRREHPIEAHVVGREPDPSYPKALTAVADVTVLHMFDSTLGDALSLAYTVVQQHHEHQTRRTTIAAAAEALRAHLAQLEEMVDDP